MGRLNLCTHLIEQIELEPAIWNATSDEYKDEDCKSRAWDRVLESMRSYGHEQSLADLKAMWKKLEDTWRRRRAQPTGSGGKNNRFNDEMSFLEEQFSGVSRSGPEVFELATSTFGPSASSRDEKISRKRKSDEPLDLLRRAASAVEAAAQKLCQQDFTRSSDDRFFSFGNWVASQLRVTNQAVVNYKMLKIATVLLDKGTAPEVRSSTSTTRGTQHGWLEVSQSLVRVRTVHSRTKEDINIEDIDE
ncbi:hypothetical protein COOONC_09538 [Cooperia oncophora]